MATRVQAIGDTNIARRTAAPVIAAKAIRITPMVRSSGLA
jgi:hypothetical protein